MFEFLSDHLAGALWGLGRKGHLTEADINATTREIRLVPLEAGVPLEVVHIFIKHIRERASEIIDSQTVNPANQIIETINEELINILDGETRRLNLSKQPPAATILAGLQGVGKTILAGKLVRYLTDQGHTPALVAYDLQRPGAVQQLEIVTGRAGVPYFTPFPGISLNSTHEIGTSEDNPVDAAFRSLAYTRQRRHDVVIIDTTGRLGIDEVLMKQARNIRDAISPYEVPFVIDSTIDQDAVEATEALRNDADFTGVAPTELDGDVRGGVVLSIHEVTGKPILFVSMGEKLKNFDVSRPDHMASRILGMSDLKMLIEVASKEVDHEQAAESIWKIGSGELTPEGFLERMMTIRKMGSIGNILEMFPGGVEMSEVAEMVDERQLDYIEAIICGMTPEEHGNPKILNTPRRRRITNDSGMSILEVNQFIEHFDKARKMMARMAGRFSVDDGCPPSRKAERGRKGKGKDRHRGVNRGLTSPKATCGGRMPGMPGMPGMQGISGVPSMAEPQKLQKQMGDQLPEDMRDFNFNSLGFGQGKK